MGLAIEEPLEQIAETGNGGPFVFLSVFAVAIPFVVNLEILNAISQALTGSRFKFHRDHGKRIAPTCAAADTGTSPVTV